MKLRADLKSAIDRASKTHATLLAAGVAFYAFLSIFPAMIAGISAYALIASPETVQAQADAIARILPADAASIINGQLAEVASSSRETLGAGALLAFLVALYSASAAAGNLVVAVNLQFAITDSRGFLKRKALGLALTAVALVVVIVTVTALTVIPVVFAHVGVPATSRWIAATIRWAVLIALVGLAIASLYRVAPSRRARGRFITLPVLLATAGWLLASGGFSVYVNNFGNYSATYGALAGVVALMLWLWIGLWIILIGAALQAVHERST